MYVTHHFDRLQFWIQSSDREPFNNWASVDRSTAADHLLRREDGPDCEAACRRFDHDRAGTSTGRHPERDHSHRSSARRSGYGPANGARSFATTPANWQRSDHHARIVYTREPGGGTRASRYCGAKASATDTGPVRDDNVPAGEAAHCSGSAARATDWRRPGGGASYLNARAHISAQFRGPKTAARQLSVLRSECRTPTHIHSLYM